MTRWIAGLAALTWSAVSAAALAQVDATRSVWMSGADLRTTFSGQTIAGLYPSGRGFVETYETGGRVRYRDEQRDVSGRWSVASGTFCTIYDGDASGGCYTVRQMGENCYEFYFVSRSSRGLPRLDEPTWTAQAWITDKPSTCVAGSEV